MYVLIAGKNSARRLDIYNYIIYVHLKQQLQSRKSSDQCLTVIYSVI